MSDARGRSAAAIAPDPRSLIPGIERQLAQCRRYGQPLVVLSIGIDRLAGIDGQALQGREAAVSSELGNRLRARTRAKDSVVCLGPLEYCVLLPGCRPQAAGGARSRLSSALGGVYALGGEQVFASVSIGLAHHTAGVDSGAALWEAAVRSRALSMDGSSRRMHFD
ncbi:MAG: diguanylate cyclase [Burkholderiales bacterium]|nr:diguanylate cyclase [Burkholderiales bacterium]